MRQTAAKSGHSSTTFEPPFYGTSPAFQATSFSIDASAPAASPVLTSAAISLPSERASGDASDGIDRAFFFWILAGLIAAALSCGAVAMSALMPASG